MRSTKHNTNKQTYKQASRQRGQRERERENTCVLLENKRKEKQRDETLKTERKTETQQAIGEHTRQEYRQNTKE